MKRITVRVFDARGCTVLSSALFQSLRDRFPDSEIVAYTKFPDLLFGLKEIDKIIDSNTHELEAYDIDLRGFLSRRPHNSEPFQHLYIHMIKHAEEQLGNKLSGTLRRDFLPRTNLSGAEIEEAQDIVKSLSDGKPTIWLQTKTNSPNKNWPSNYWKRLIEEKSKEYTFIDLSTAKYKPRTSLAITKCCDAGIALDSFLLHGSKSVGAKNVIVILGSSRPEVVTYPDQIVLYGAGDCKIQPCGMHGYVIGCKQEDETLFTEHEETRCITNDYRCLHSIASERVMKALEDVIRKEETG